MQSWRSDNKIMSERPKLKDLVEELHDVKAKWKSIGIQLEISMPTLDRIESKHKNNPEEAFTEMMGEWLKQDDEPPSWPAIVNALRSRSVNERRLAKKVEINKCPNRDDKLTDDSYTGNLITIIASRLLKEVGLRD